MRVMGQATVEWLLVSAAVTSIIWLAQSHFSLLDELRQLGARVIDFYHYVLNYVPLGVGTGL